MADENNASYELTDKEFEAAMTLVSEVMRRKAEYADAQRAVDEANGNYNGFLIGLTTMHDLPGRRQLQGKKLVRVG